MAYIAPNSTVRLLKNCPLDKTYDHTLYFASKSAQTTYFEGLTKSPSGTYTFTEYSYIRKNRGIKVQLPAGANAYDCNYLMFKNTSFENKWFYAFISSVEYVNNYTWEIEFELDVMQTWFFDYDLERCFVEREHSATDEIGDNLVPETIEMGDYVSEGITRCADTGSATESLLQALSLVFACTFDRNYADYRGGYYRGMYSGLCFVDFPFPVPATTTNISTFVNNVRTWVDGAVAQGKVNGIITAFVCPTALVSSDTSTSSNMGFSKTITYNDIDGYTPKNNKLFTYPYNFMYVNNFQGQTAEYHFEYFSNPSSIGFKLEGDYTVNPEIVLTPLNYKGAGATGNYDERLTLGKYPILPFATDVFQAWMSMDASGQIISLAGNVATGAILGSIVPAVGTAVGAVGGALTSITSLLSQGYKKEIAPPQTQGTSSGAHALASIRLIDFGFRHKHVRAEFARIIDNFFTMYGYATHRCKIPNRHVRPHWTYTKTVGCCVRGDCPADDMKKICEIYDRGITFWMNGSEVGDYTLNNRPT